MLAKDTAPFERALEQLKKFDADLVHRRVRLEQANEKLLAAKLDLAAVDKRIAAFARDGSSDIAQASALVTQQTQCRAIESLLEQSIESLTNGLAETQADALLAERDCANAQLAYHEKRLGDAVAEFLGAHRGELAQLTAQARVVERFRGYGVVSVPSVFDVLSYVLRTAQVTFDTTFHESVKVKESPITTPQLSEAIDTSTRSRIGPSLGNGRHAVIAMLAPRAETKPDPFDMDFAIQSARSAAESAEHHRARVAEYEQRLNRHPGDASEKEQLDMHRREADRYDEIVERWDGLISSNRHATA